MGCNCGKPKCDGKCGISPAVLQINNPSECVIFHKVDVPASMGDSTTNPPKTGAYKNVLLYYEADQTSWLYSSDGIPVRLTNGITNYEDAINLPQINGETLIGDKSSADLKLADVPMVITIASGNTVWSGADTAEDIYNFFLNQGKVNVVFEGSENYGYEIVSAAYIPGEQKMMCMVTVASVDTGSSPVEFSGNALYGLMTFYTAGKAVDVGELDLQPKLFVADFTGLELNDNILSGVPATNAHIGMVKPSDGLSVSSDGTLTVIGHVFDTVADMKASTELKNGDYAQTLGSHSLNDGGGAVYYISDTGTANEHDVIAVGELYAIYVNTDGEVSVKQFGAKGDGTTDDTDAIQYAVNYAFNHNLNVRIDGTDDYYKVTLPIVANVYRSASGYWYGIGSKIIGENVSNSRIVKIGDAVHTSHSNPNVNNVNATLICANTNVSLEKGVGIYLDSISLENYTDSSMATKTSGSMGLYTNVSRSTYKNLNISAYKGIIAVTFSCLYENIVYNCTENALTLTSGTSNTFRFMYAPGCTNPYNITSSYSSLLSVCCDGAKGTLFALSGMGLSLIDCGAESKNAQYIFKITSGFTTLKIDNFFMHRQIGDTGLALEDCAVVYCDQQAFVDIDNISICEFDAIDTTQHNSTFFHVVGNATTMLTTNLKNLRYYKNFSGTNNGRMKLWDSRPGAQCVQRYSTPPIEMSYVVTPTFEIYPFIGGYYGTDLTIDSQGNSINPANISASKTIWLDCKDQYHNENGTEIRYLTRHEKGDVQLFNDPLARNALGYSVTEKVNNYTWNVAEIPIVMRGATADRPTTNKYIGLTYFDTTLGKPVYWNGSNWVDATGATV